MFTVSVRCWPIIKQKASTADQHLMFVTFNKFPLILSCISLSAATHNLKMTNISLILD